MFYLTHLYCWVHCLIKKILKRNQITPVFLDVENESLMHFDKDTVFPVENIFDIENYHNLKKSYIEKKKINTVFFKETDCCKDVASAWALFIKNSEIQDGYRYGGFHLGGYILEFSNWCLPSWIWTNAALVRYYCSVNDIEKAERIGELFLEEQQQCGGWLVRYDYIGGKTVPQLAPNDSAYIANNACLSLFKLTGDKRFLNSAILCADWIIETARPDGFVYLGFNMDKKVWNKDVNIVDTGFTAGLFAELYEITKDNKYKTFLERFLDKYIELFYNKSIKRFWTTIKNDKPFGGSFGRGQAWALEGLIPAYRVLRSEYLKEIIEDTISTLLKEQHKNGGWAYNLDRPLMGEDCKGIAVIAKSLLDWYNIEKNEDLKSSASKALKWCVVHTSSEGISKGGIFSFCLEGAIVHNLYTSTALVYSSAYALEVYNRLQS